MIGVTFRSAPRTMAILTSDRTMSVKSKFMAEVYVTPEVAKVPDPSSFH
jgi:hypothetical protein